MSNVMSAAQRALYRRPNWRWLAGAISLAIVTIAGITLYRVCHEVKFAHVIDALKTQTLRTIFLSCLFVAAGYLTLTCYDVFALRAIGRGHLPYRVAAFASFTSYTIGHNIGAAILTSGVIRYRIYSAWGLSVGDIARIAFITGLTYWLGNAFVLGCGIALAPGAASAVNYLPAPVNRLIGLAALTAINCYMLWLLPRPRSIGRLPWRVTLPNPASTLVQIAIGSLDLVFVTLAMYALLPAQPAIDFLDVLVVFVAAMLIGVVSYVPGSLGVIEAAMFLSLPQFPREDLLASLLTFRLFYFVVPLLLASLLFGLREARMVAAAMTRNEKAPRPVTARKSGCSGAG
ncbi:MAG: YbhN family protein [Xanthobacteraceae bacterium]